MQTFRDLRRWTPNTKIYYGWIILGVASLGTFASTGSAQVTLAGVQSFILAETGWDRESLAIGVTIGTWTAGILTPLVGYFADRKGPRLFMPIAAIIIGICFYFLAGASTLWQFSAAYVIARGIGTPVLISVMPRTVAVNFFYRWRNLALGLISMARPFYGAINVQIISLLAIRSSWRTGYRVIGIYSVLLSIPLILFMRKAPEEIGLLPDGVSADPIKTSEKEGQRQISEEISWTSSEAMKTKALWLIGISQFLIILTLGNVSFQLVPFLNYLGLSLPLAALAWSLTSVLDSFSHPFWGFMSDKYSPRRLMFVGLPSVIVATFLFLLVNDIKLAFGLVLLWGTSSGGLEVLGGMLLASYYGRNSYGTIAGIIGPFQILGLGLGPTLGAFMFKMTNGYETLFLFSVASYIVATFLIVLAKRPVKTAIGIEIPQK